MSADLEALSREIAATSDAVRLAIAAVKANPPHPESPMPWRRRDGGIGEVMAADDSLVCEMAVDEDAAHIAAAVNAAPVLVAEVERLQAVVEAARVAFAPVRHAAGCDALAFRSCDCDATLNHAEAVAKARRALGLEVGK